MSNYYTSARFSLPDDALLDTDQIKCWDINRLTYTLPLSNFILYPTSPTKSTSNTKGKTNKGFITKKLTALTLDEHNVKELKKRGPIVSEM